MLGRRHLVGLALGLGLVAAAGAAEAAYPDRPITLICPWGAGGGTDATARIVASILERELGVPVNVVNRTGGSRRGRPLGDRDGGPDGYTLGIITVEIGMMHWQGLTELTYKDYTPLALMNEDPAGPAGAGGRALRLGQGPARGGEGGAGKGELKASGTGQGGIWHLALAGMLQAGRHAARPGAVGAEPGGGPGPAGSGGGRRRDGAPARCPRRSR